jgi:sortase B
MKDGRSKSLWTVVLVLCAVVAVACIGALIWLHVSEESANRQLAEAVKPHEPVAETPSRPVAPPPVSSETSEPTEEPVEIEPADVPIDFDYLQGINPDIYGWIDLTCTDQGYPVLSNAGNPDLYLHLDVNGLYANAGSLYSQSTFNKTEFVDPCTVIFGHNMTSGRMFGKLQSTAPLRNLDDEESSMNYFSLYTPTKIQKYRIYAAGVFSNQNVLYFYDFSDEESFEKFFEDFESYPQGVHYISGTFEPEFGDQIAILSTCYTMNNKYRFLTVGVLVEQEGI